MCRRAEGVSIAGFPPVTAKCTEAVSSTPCTSGSCPASGPAKNASHQLCVDKAFAIGHSFDCISPSFHKRVGIPWDELPPDRLAEHAFEFIQRDLRQIDAATDQFISHGVRIKETAMFSGWQWQLMSSSDERPNNSAEQSETRQMTVPLKRHNSIPFGRL